MVENTANQHTPNYLQILKSVRKCRVLVPPSTASRAYGCLRRAGKRDRPILKAMNIVITLFAYPAELLLLKRRSLRKFQSQMRGCVRTTFLAAAMLLWVPDEHSSPQGASEINR